MNENEKMMPCPFCKSTIHMVKKGESIYRAGCTCGYSTPFYATQELVISKHNNIVKKVIDNTPDLI